LRSAWREEDQPQLDDACHRDDGEEDHDDDGCGRAHHRIVRLPIHVSPFCERWAGQNANVGAPEWWRGPRLHEGWFSTVGRAGRLSVHTLGTCPRCEGRNHSFLHAPCLSVTESEILSHFFVRFLMREGCHLCDQARPLVRSAASRSGVGVVEVDIDDDDGLVARYGLRIPVILGPDEQVLAEGVIDDVRALRRAMKRLAR
jgi:hypothetical protein